MKIHDIIKEDECYTEFYYTKEKYPKLFDNELDISQEINKEDTNLKKINKEKQIQIKNSIAEIKSLIDFIDNDK